MVSWTKENNRGQTCFFRDQSAVSGVIHTGDNRTGEGDGDDEAVNVEFARIEENVDVLFFLISNYASVGPPCLPPCCCTNLFMAGDMRMNIQGTVNGDKQVRLSRTYSSTQTRTRTRTHAHTHTHTYNCVKTTPTQTFARFDMASLSCFDRCCSNGIVVGALRKTPPDETDSNGWEFVAIGDTYTQIGVCGFCGQHAGKLANSVLSKHSWVSDKAARGANSFSALPPPPPSDIQLHQV